jgi:glycosyltransferase involved in cell wall biosynthesis
MFLINNELENILVSVIMTVYNGAEYLEECIESVLNQNHKNFEFIIIDDGSTDSTLNILKKYEKIDSRIKLITRENKGLVASLNECLSIASGNFIARMDADDINELNRLSEQLKYLICNEDVAVLGSKVSIINELSETIAVSKPLTNYILHKSALFTGATFIHPSVMFNRRLLGDDLRYDENAYLCEDYELWLRLSLNFKLTNTNANLFKYRTNNKGLSQSNWKSQINSAATVASNFYIDKPNDDDVKYFCMIMNNREFADKKLKTLSAFFKLMFKCKDSWTYYWFIRWVYLFKIIKS